MKVPPISYSFHQNYKQCPRKAWHINIAKDLKQEPTDAMDWGIRVHEACEKRINANEPFPDGFKHYEEFFQFPDGYTAAAEVKLGMDCKGQPCDFHMEGVYFRGVLDVILEQAPGNGTACIIDHKTGKVREDPTELRMHAVLLKAHRPHLQEIKGWYNWLAGMKMGPIHDLSDTETVFREMNRRHEQITAAVALGERAFAPKQGPLFGYCPVKTCEFHP
jgi:hypothetical protein